jgi:hypothetical protein
MFMGEGSFGMPVILPDAAAGLLNQVLNKCCLAMAVMNADVISQPRTDKLTSDLTSCRYSGVKLSAS